MSYTTVHERISMVCPICGTTFTLMPCEYRKRMKASKSGILVCSGPCYGELRARMRSYANLKAAKGASA